MTRKQPDSPLDTRDGERVLWVNVVLQAIRDATDCTTAGSKSEKMDARRRARAWFKLANPDFVEVCHCAHLDPEVTYRNAMQAIARYDAAVASGETYRVERDEPKPQRRTPQTYTHEGETHTIAEWAAITGISVGALRGRLSAGRTIEEAITCQFQRKPLVFNGNPKGRPAKLYEIDGVSRTLNEWATVYGVHPHRVAQRLLRGYSIEAALSAKRMPTITGKLHTINGVSKTLTQWAEHAGITPNTLHARMNKGRTLAEAVAMPKGKNTRRGVVSNLDALEGTGAWGSAQETTEITFPQEAKSE